MKRNKDQKVSEQTNQIKHQAPEPSRSRSLMRLTGKDRKSGHALPPYPITCCTRLRYLAGMGFSSRQTMFMGRLPVWLT